MTDVAHLSSSPQTPFHPGARSALAASGGGPRVGWALGYLAATGLVGLTVAVGFAAASLAPTASLTMLFVLPVLIAALVFGYGPGVLGAALSALAFNFFFVPPLFSFQVASIDDMWALGLMLIVALAAGLAGAQSRRHALAARRAAVRAEQLHAVAHLVVEGARPTAVARKAAEALQGALGAPSLILAEAADGRLDILGEAGAPAPTAGELAAAGWALQHDRPIRGENYPFETSRFDFWPLRTGGKPGIVIGVARDDDAEDAPSRQIELVGVYVAASLKAAPDVPRD